MQTGTHKLKNNLLLAPMAGITDQLFLLLCRENGAALLVSEMVTSNPVLFHTRKTRLRLTHAGEPEPRAVQIAGADPEMMAESARFNVEHGAQIIDINRGCPAKKICNAMAGSALLRDEKRIADILETIVNINEISNTLIKHLSRLYQFYGEYPGARIARKHIGWYCKQQKEFNVLRASINRIKSADEQISTIKTFFIQQQVLVA